jgi:hypothetical protein
MCISQKPQIYTWDLFTLVIQNLISKEKYVSKNSSLSNDKYVEVFRWDCSDILLNILQNGIGGW